MSSSTLPFVPPPYPPIPTFPQQHPSTLNTAAPSCSSGSTTTTAPPPLPLPLPQSYPHGTVVPNYAPHGAIPPLLLPPPPIQLFPPPGTTILPPPPPPPPGTYYPSPQPPQPPPAPITAKPTPKTEKRGRKKGAFFKHVTNDDIRSWCLDLFSSQLSLRPFCKQHNVVGKRSTISRHFRDSGLMKLKHDKNSTIADAKAVMDEYLYKRGEQKSKGREPKSLPSKEAKHDDDTENVPEDDDDDDDDEDADLTANSNDETTTPASTKPTRTRPPRAPKTANLGRKKGDTYKLCTDDEIRAWCLDYFSSKLTLRPFCKQNGLEARRSTISRHFRDSGLMELKNKDGTQGHAETLITRYLWKREALTKARMNKMHEANRKRRSISRTFMENLPSDKEPFRIYTNEEVKSWCMEYFTSDMPLRMFCLSRGLFAKRKTINKHFKESGLSALKKKKGSVEEANAAMQEYLTKRDEKKRSYVAKMHKGRDKMLAMREKKKREDEVRSMVWLEREKWFREEYRNTCAVFAKGEWTFERFREVYERMEQPFTITHNGFEVSIKQGEPEVELCNLNDKDEQEKEEHDSEEEESKWIKEEMDEMDVIEEEQDEEMSKIGEDDEEDEVDEKVDREVMMKDSQKKKKENKANKKGDVNTIKEEQEEEDMESSSKQQDSSQLSWETINRWQMAI